MIVFGWVHGHRAGAFESRKCPGAVRIRNGENILASEGYKARAGCDNGIASVKKNASEESRYEKKETDAGKFMFNLRAGNNQVIGTSQSYASASSRDKGIESVKRNAPDAKIVDLTEE